MTPEEIVGKLKKVMKIKKINNTEEYISLSVNQKIIQQNRTTITIIGRGHINILIDLMKNEITISDGKVTLAMRNKYPIGTILKRNRLIRLLIFKRDPGEGESICDNACDGGDPVRFEINRDEKGELKVKVFINVDSLFKE